LTENWNIGIKLSEIETAKLITIVNDLFEAKALDSKDMQDFLRFTLFIVFDEYEKSKESLRKFYNLNFEKYRAYKTENR
jgi:hypothetical protein